MPDAARESVYERAAKELVVRGYIEPKFEATVAAVIARNCHVPATSAAAKPACPVCDRQPVCRDCGAKATCYGTYEGVTGYSCDDCCGHGCEDGHCDLLESILLVPAPGYAELREAAEAAKEYIANLRFWYSRGCLYEESCIHNDEIESTLTAALAASEPRKELS